MSFYFQGSYKKTLLELAQGRITWRQDFENARRNAYKPRDYNSIRKFEDHVNLFTSPDMFEKVSFLFEGETIQLKDLVNSNLQEEKGDFFFSYDKIWNNGYTPYYYDLSRDYLSRLGFFVTRVIIPGLLEISNDHVHQRLGNRRINGYYQQYKHVRNFTYNPDFLNPIPHPFP